MLLNAAPIVNRLLSTKALLETAAGLEGEDGELRARELLRRARGYLRVSLAELGEALDETEAPDEAGAMAEVLGRFRDAAKAGKLAGVFVIGLHPERGVETGMVAPTPAAEERLYGALAARALQGLRTAA